MCVSSHFRCRPNAALDPPPRSGSDDRTSRALQFEYEERACVINGKNIDRADRRGILDGVAASRINIELKPFPINIDSTNVLRNEVAQLKLEAKRRIGCFCLLRVVVRTEYSVKRRIRGTGTP